MMNPVPWLQMTNMISYQGLVRTFLSELADLLLDEDVSDDLSYFEWNRTVTTFKYSLQNTARSKEIGEKKVVLAIDYLSRNNREVTYSETKKSILTKK